jgi:AcrR family transcriptional regulator
MPAQTEPRVPLSRERVLLAAVKIADDHGIGALTMRRLAEEVGAEAMSLYYHVAKKDDVLDGVTEVIAAEIVDAAGRIAVPADGSDWKTAVRKRILAAREVLLRHKWAAGVFETRTTTSPVMLGYFDGLIGLMRAGGFSNDLAHHAMHALGSRAVGFAQELFAPPDGPVTEESLAAIAQMADAYPHLTGMLREVAHDDPESTVGWGDDQSEFEFGLDLILDGLDRLRAQGWRAH